MCNGQCHATNQQMRRWVIWYLIILQYKTRCKQCIQLYSAYSHGLTTIIIIPVKRQQHVIYKFQSTIDLRCYVPGPCMRVRRLRVRAPSVRARISLRVVSARAYTVRPCMRVHVPAAMRTRYRPSWCFSACAHHPSARALACTYQVSRLSACVHRPCVYAHACTV